MHMADALLSPTVGVSMWGATATIISYCSVKVKKNLDNTMIPMMGALGSFVFVAQMINFAIPGTGASGHFGGGLLLAILLGPHASFLTVSSILTIQALFFADGGLLALGCNIFNIGFFPCFIGYPLIYNKILNSTLTKSRIVWSSIIAAVIGIQLGAFGIVLQTTLSRITELPFSIFLLFLQPIHLVIGIIEGFITAGVILYIWKARPELLGNVNRNIRNSTVSIKKIIIFLVLATVFTGAIMTWFASQKPDGLEWAVSQVSGKKELVVVDNNVHVPLADLQNTVSILPDYNFSNDEEEGEQINKKVDNLISTNVGKSVAGLVGGLLTLFVIFTLGLVLKKKVRSTTSNML